MIAVDTNVLVYAHRQEMQQHHVGRRALAALAEGNEPWAIPVFVVNEFLSVVTHPRVFRSPTPAPQAAAALERLFETPTLRVLHPGERFWPLLGVAIEEGHARGDLMLDAAIVALSGARRDDDPVRRSRLSAVPVNIPATPMKSRASNAAQVYW